MKSVNQRRNNVTQTTGVELLLGVGWSLL